MRRTAVVFFPGGSSQKLAELARALARGIQAQGHTADVVDGSKESPKLTVYQYICLGTESVSFTGKIPPQVPAFLSNAGMISGKRCYAFVPKRFVSAPRALARLMKSMEGQGLFLKNSTVLTSAQEAEEIGKRLHID